MPYSCKTLITSANELAPREKRLSICLGANGFSFTETSTAGVLISFAEYLGPHAGSINQVMTDVKSVFASLGIRPFSFSASDLIVLSNESVWVPDELYTATANRKYLMAVGSEPATVMTGHSAALASTAVFSADEHLVTAFKVALPGINVMNQHMKMARLAPQCAGHSVILSYWREGRVDLAAFNEGRYLYGNTFAFANANEALYHVVDVVKSFGLESPSTELMMCGEVDRDRYAQFRPYFPKVTLFNGTITQSLNPEFKRVHAYRHALILM